MHTLLMLATHLLKEGLGPLYVFLHGFLGTSSDWEAVCSHFPDCRCIGVDLPGHGASPLEGAFPEFEERIHLVGYSMGGRVAMQVAARQPERIASLTVCSTHPGLRGKQERLQRLENDRAWAEKLLHLSEEEFLSEWYSQPLFGGFRPPRKLGNREALAHALMEYSLGKMPYIEVPARTIVGERDEKFRKLWPQATVIPNAAHMLHLENPRALASLLKQEVV